MIEPIKQGMVRSYYVYGRAHFRVELPAEIDPGVGSKQAEAYIRQKLEGINGGKVKAEVREFVPDFMVAEHNRTLGKVV
jgi:hypothetical protein